jgi:hypothetical protein
MHFLRRRRYRCKARSHEKGVARIKQKDSTHTHKKRDHRPRSTADPLASDGLAACNLLAHRCRLCEAATHAAALSKGKYP